jgi:hypothetical protein
VDTLVKYPRTLHLPWSPGATSDDKVMSDTSDLDGEFLWVTEKMDGGNFTMTSERCYSRSPSATSNPWDGPARAEWARVRMDIPPGWRVVGESMHARRSVAYDNLEGPFLVFAVFDDRGTLLSFGDVTSWAQLLDLPLVPVLCATMHLSDAHAAWERCKRQDISEGYVVRVSDAITPEEFSRRVGKYVRANHVQTSDDWRHRDDFAINGWQRRTG